MQADVAGGRTVAAQPPLPAPQQLPSQASVDGAAPAPGPPFHPPKPAVPADHISNTQVCADVYKLLPVMPI